MTKTSAEILASLTVEQLRAGVKKADEAIRWLSVVEDMEERAGIGDDYDGPFPPSKTFEKWRLDDMDERRRQYRLAKELSVQELVRRGVSP